MTIPLEFEGHRWFHLRFLIVVRVITDDVVVLIQMGDGDDTRRLITLIV